VTSDERVTPQWLYDALDAEFHFVLDAAATAENAKTRRYCSLDACDGLGTSWARLCEPEVGDVWVGTRPHVWCNPPYSRGSILQWCAKAEREASEGVTTAMLLPADTSTEYFQRYALQHECRFVNRRLSFAGAPTDKAGRLAPAKFGSLVVVFRPSHGLWTWR
jgi:phage N-6-adenine-methyltransferase